MIYKLVLEMPPVPKERPRVTGRGTYYKNNYSEWLTKAKESFIEQWKGNPPLTKVGECSIKMYGTHNRSDIDNLSGSVLDALVKAQVLKNDNTKVLADLHSVFVKVKENPRIEIWLDTTLWNSVECQWNQRPLSESIKGVSIE